jgi:hypothetical protein
VQWIHERLVVVVVVVVVMLLGATDSFISFGK